MLTRAETIFYWLTTLVLGTAFFILQPSNVEPVAKLQSEIKTEFQIAFVQSIGDQPILNDVWLVVDSVHAFYTEAADSTIALISQPETEEDLIMIASKVYGTFAAVFSSSPVSSSEEGLSVSQIMTGNFMSEDPIYNIIPQQDSLAAAPEVKSETKIAGKAFITTPAVNSKNEPWVTVEDNLTGEYFCISIYNSQINRYKGACKYDYE